MLYENQAFALPNAVLPPFVSKLGFPGYAVRSFNPPQFEQCLVTMIAMGTLVCTLVAYHLVLVPETLNVFSTDSEGLWDLEVFDEWVDLVEFLAKCIGAGAALANLVRDVDMKRDYAFVEFSDPRDADDARHYLDGRDIDGSRITVEFSRGAPRGSRDYDSRGPPPGSGRCFNCGVDGHWARDCTAGDWKNKCYRCGERGHIERNCKNSPKKLRRSGSYSRSPVRSRSPPRRRRSPSRSLSRSYSRSRSPVRRRERSVEERSRSPKRMDDSLSPRGRDRSPVLDDEGSPKIIDGSPPPSPKLQKEDGSDRDGGSPQDNENGRNSGAGGDSPREDRSPVDDDYEPNRASPRGSESP